MVRAALYGDSPSDRLSGLSGESDLGSPVREICTPGSAWGIGHKARGSRAKARSYQPQHRSLADATGGQASYRLPMAAAVHRKLAESPDVGGGRAADRADGGNTTRRRR